MLSRTSTIKVVGCLDSRGLKTRGTGVSAVTYHHVWFSPKERKPILEGDLARTVRDELDRAAEEHEVQLLECELGTITFIC